MKTLITLLALSTSLVSSSFAQSKSQYKTTDLTKSSSALILSLADPKVSKDFIELMKRSNSITKIIEKNDILVADVIRKIFIIEAQFCSLKLRGCLGGGRLTINMSQGTFLPPGMESKPHYDSKVEFYK